MDTLPNTQEQKAGSEQRVIFLTIRGLFSYAWDHREQDWGGKALFFLDTDKETTLDRTLAGDDPDWIKVQGQITEVVAKAETDGRVAWRTDDAVENQRALNAMLVATGSYEGMNPNLPPADDIVFLRRALCTAPGVYDSSIIA